MYKKPRSDMPSRAGQLWTPSFPVNHQLLNDFIGCAPFLLLVFHFTGRYRGFSPTASFSWDAVGDFSLTASSFMGRYGKFSLTASFSWDAMEGFRPQRPLPASISRAKITLSFFWTYPIYYWLFDRIFRCRTMPFPEIFQCK